ncbi:carboxypeptidase-like regulatory domain-containing protein [Ancylomarina sp.]|uniref:carboxypeptidase-like regulatory domain-containing protein n=1 Tax=Ancylomarina sp. TaxID=1970196 RepID=UPI0035644F97
MRLITFLLILFTTSTFAQTVITGKVADQTNQTLPGSSVYIKGSYIGTVSNRQGNFKIKIPKTHQSSKLCFSSIGYQTKEIKLTKLITPLLVKLQKDTAQLNEVLVMPKDTLLALLRRAYGKIKDNYPDLDTRMKGFYRETYYNPDKDEYLYFGEAIVDVFKTPYSNTSKGQVKVVESRMNKHPLYHKYSSVMWYGGLHFPLTSDDVKRRASYLSPNDFKKYDYSIYKDKLDGKSVYRIEFTPKEDKKVRYQGKFYLDINSLAYLYYESSYTDYGIKERNKSLSRFGLKVTKRTKQLKYKYWNGKYYFSYISDTENLYNKKTQSDLIQFIEYLTTDINILDTKPIPFTEQTELTDVFYLKAEDIQESNWEDQTLIQADSSLTKLMEYSPKKSDLLLHKEHDLPKGYQFKQKLMKVLTHTYADIYIGAKSNKSIAAANIIYSPSSDLSFNKSIDTDNSPEFSWGMKVGYKFNAHFDINYDSQEAIGKNISELKSLGFAYETPIINRGRQLLLMCGVNYFFSQDGIHIGDFKSESNFKAGGKKFNADKIALYVGKKKQGVSFDLGLRTKLKKFYSLFVMGGYQFNLQEQDRLFIQEKSGFFLTRKKANISLKDSSIEYFENGVQTSTTNFDTNKFHFKVGIRIML